VEIPACNAAKLDLSTTGSSGRVSKAFPALPLPDDARQDRRMERTPAGETPVSALAPKPIEFKQLKI
jgi:hypothetical protein